MLKKTVVPLLLIVVIFILSKCELYGQSDPLLRHAMVTIDPVSDFEAFKPSPLPDRINLTWNDDPATTQAVSWRTDESVERAFGQIAKSCDGPLFWHDTVWAKTNPLETNLGISHYHTVVFRDLEPATEYIYRVGDGMNWSEWFHFRTASEDPEPFTFVYFGDVQEDIKSQSSRVIRRAFRDASDARFFLYGGDLVDNAHNDGEWGEWFDAHGFISAMVPLVPVPGNHEFGEDRLSDQWSHQFALPENGPKELLEAAYYIDYQGVRIISLSSAVHVTRHRINIGIETEELQKIQTDWMARAGEDLQMYQVISIHEDTLFYEAKTAKGMLYDAFRSEKRDGEPNEIIDMIPGDVEEILRDEDSNLPEVLRPWFYHERRFIDSPRR